MEERLQRLADEYWDGEMARSPFAATMFGDHRFDDRIPDLGPEGLAEHRAFAAGIEEQARQLGTLDDVGDSITQALLVDACRSTIEAIDRADIELSSDGFTGYPVSLLRSAARLSAPDGDSAGAQLRRLAELPEAVDATVAHWRRGAERGWLPVSTIVARTRAMVEAYLAGSIGDDPFVGLDLADDIDAPAWRERAATVVADHVRPAYRRVADTLAALELIGRDDDHPGLCHLAGGDEHYASLVRRATTTDLDPTEIHEFGLQELTERLPAEWAAVGGRAVGISDRAELFAHLADDPALRYDDADEILSLATGAIERAMAESPRWFARLPRSAIVVQAVPDSLAPGSPPAYYSAPPADGSKPGVYSANTHEPTRRNRFEAEVFAFHEAVPGHHLERASAVELDVPMFQRRSSYMAYSEGWGLYAERLADEMGVYSSDVMRLGMLSADAWRSARLVIDTGLHAMGWTRSQSIEFLTTHVPIDVDVAAVEVDRYIGMPGQALSYKIGQRELFRLRERAMGRLGERFDIAGFHHAVLEHGAVPLTVLGQLVDRWVDDRLRTGAP